MLSYPDTHAVELQGIGEDKYQSSLNPVIFQTYLHMYTCAHSSLVCSSVHRSTILIPVVEKQKRRITATVIRLDEL